MIRTGIPALGALTVLVFAASLIYLVQEQRQQARELARLKNCVSILERNQGMPSGDRIMGCPIHN